MESAESAAPLAAGPYPRAPATLIFIPGLGHDGINAAEVVASSIASEANMGRGVVEAKTSTATAPRGLRAVSTLFADGRRVLDIVELDYRDDLEALDREPLSQREGVPPGLLRTTVYSFSGLWLWMRAIPRGNKAGMAKAQLLAGALLVFLLCLALVLTWVAAVAALVAGTGLEAYLPQWMTAPDRPVALLGGLISAAVYAKYRTRILRTAQRIRQLMMYLREPAEAVRISRSLSVAVDALLDEQYEGDIHLLAYSFGGLVVIDDLIPASGTPVAVTERVAERITSLVTVGCPHDFVRLYFPQHFRRRRPRRTDLPWRNIFIASDVLGSNFLEGDDTKACRSSVAGMPVDSFQYLPSERLTWTGLLRQAGLRQHTKYWDPGGGCWGFVLDLWGFDAPAPAPRMPALPPQRKVHGRRAVKSRESAGVHEAAQVVD
jgi:hypothetical protein